MATALDERPIWQLYDVPTRSTKGGYVRGGQGSEVHGGGRFLPGETPETDPLPGVWS